MNLKEKYNELSTQRDALRKEAITAVCNKVAGMLAGTGAKKLDYVIWSREAFDLQAFVTIFTLCLWDTKPIIAVEPKGTDEFEAKVYCESDAYLNSEAMSIDEIMSVIDDLEALEQSLSGEASEGKIEWKVNGNGVVEYIGDAE